MTDMNNNKATQTQSRNRRPWTNEEIEYMGRNDGKFSAEHYAQRFDRSSGAIRQKSYSLNILLVEFSKLEINFSEIEIIAFCQPWN